LTVADFPGADWILILPGLAMAGCAMALDGFGIVWPDAHGFGRLQHRLAIYVYRLVGFVIPSSGFRSWRSLVGEAICTRVRVHKSSSTSHLAPRGILLIKNYPCDDGPGYLGGAAYAISTTGVSLLETIGG
jgi:hypothetical protein